MKSKVNEKYAKHEYRNARIAVRKYLLTGEQRQNGWLLHSRDHGTYTYVIARQAESGTVSWAHRVDLTGRLYRISKDKLIRFDASELAVQSLQAFRMSASDIVERGEELFDKTAEPFPYGQKIHAVRR